MSITSDQIKNLQDIYSKGYFAIKDDIGLSFRTNQMAPGLIMLSEISKEGEI